MIIRNNEYPRSVDVKKRGGEGELACGTEGRGRMPEPAEVLAATEALLG